MVGYLKDLNDYRVRVSAVMFKEMLSICSHLQYQFEYGKVLVFEIQEKVDNVVDDIQELNNKYNHNQESDDTDINEVGDFPVDENGIKDWKKVQ